MAPKDLLFEDAAISYGAVFVDGEMSRPRPKRFGQHPPPVSKLIKNILDRYPDGQIFKELIQNADDAGAEVVRFYIDPRPAKAQSASAVPELASYQGPALIAANDAVFTDKDWDGIQRLQDSVKAEDPFNVGKFGIGFNAVYHITEDFDIDDAIISADVPSIISGDTVVYLDPQETLWPREPGAKFNLSELQETDVLATLNGIEGFSSSTTNYPKTLFRFPLRTQPSDLSENTYSVDDLIKLIDSLRDEAKFLLLFLRSVHTVEVYSIDSSSSRQKLHLRVQVAPTDQVELSQQRISFKSELKAKHSLQEYNITPCISRVAQFSILFTDQKATQSTSWLVANQVGSSDTVILAASRRQCCFPWVGVAMEMDKNSGQHASSESSNGRIFCFLPMPVETSSNLPVHVNGTFGLNDDRRTIKWPGGERRNDPSALWNQMLVTHCLPSCYNLLLRSAVRDYHIVPELFYHAWPCKTRLQFSPWKLVVDPLLKLVFEWKCLWSQQRNKWVSIGRNVVIYDDDDLPEVVKRVLTACGKSVCEVPEHVFSAVNRLVPCISPTVVRNSLRSEVSAYRRESYYDKLELLRYCLKDDNYSSLNGIELLPLANGTYDTFSTSTFACNKYIICSKRYPRNLLPNIDSELVDLTSIDRDLHKKLQALADSSSTQLRPLSVDSVAKLLPKCFPHHWKNSKTVELTKGDAEFPHEWWTIFWTWVQNHVHSLSPFKDLHIVPLVTTSDSRVVRATKLSTNSNVVVVDRFDTCSVTLLSALQKVSIQFVFIKHFTHLRHRELYNYLNSYSAVGVLTAIANSGVLVRYVSFTGEEATEIQQFLGRQVLWSLSHSHRDILKNLCVFSVLNHRSLTSIVDASGLSWNKLAIFEPDSFTFTGDLLPSNMVVLSRTKNKAELIQACGSVQMPNVKTFLMDYLFQMIQDGSCSEDKIDKLMEHVLRYYFPVLCSDVDFICALKCLPFLPCSELYGTITRKAPSDLYDSSDTLLREIFQDMPVFPLAPFNESRLLLYLRMCDLKTSVSAQQLFDIVNEAASIHYSDTPQSTSEQRLTQLKAILSYIKNNPSCLNEWVASRQDFRQNHLSSSLKQLSKNWLPVQSTSPQCYPTRLTWKGDKFKSHLVSHKSHSVLVYSEGDLKHCAMIVGSQMYCAVCPQVLCKTLQPKIPIDKVFAHLLHIIRRRQYFTGSVLDKLVHHIYEYLCNHISEVRSHCSTTDLSHQDLIWIKKQHRFASAQEIVLSERPSFPYSLAPFYDVISDSLNDYMKLFQELGVKNELSDKDIVSVLRKIKDNEGGRISDESAWKMVQHVLNWLTDSGECLASEKLDEDCNGALLIPIQSNSDRPVLVPVEEVVYTDLDFLKSFQSTEEETSFIHERVAHLARPLGVKPLSTHLNVSYDAFDDVGQHEPLVTRLKNILKDYKDGLTIVKELLQNADDAGATELTICYDARSHTVSEKSLLFQGMAKCHGPALLVHNNAAFTDEDFKNITKLAGGTKMNKPLKIGKFGVGFCSVYHITDVPSFISGKWLYIFDPTLSHLEKEIQDRSRPGKKLPFTEKLVRISKQLEPYKSLFGFDENREYDGTFFRFPFRTSGSEISTVIYDESHVQSLLRDLKLAGSKLLLFLSNLKRITFSRIDDDEGLSTLYSIEKESASATQAGLEYILPDYTELCKVHHCDADSTYQHSKTELWLLASVVEDSDDYGKPATSTVACAIETNSLTATYTPQAINGEIFCYLPLSLQTGMPIHVSANFAVLNDRTGIHASDTDLSYEIEWNLELMKTVVPTAYYSLLLALKSLCENHKVSVSDYEFYSLWPLKEKLKSHNPWDTMVRHLYYKITKSELFYSHCTVKWLKLCDAHILAESVLTQMITEQHSPHQCVVNVFDELKYSLLRLPPSYQKHISQSELQPRMINEKRFTEIFFDEIGGISIETRNSVLFLILKVYAINSSNYLKDALVRNSCVPCSSDGTVLRMCHEIVDPKAEFSELYDDADKVFPTKSFYNDSLVRKALFDLNIIHDLLPWTNVLERANTIQLKHATNPLASLKRAMCILRCIKQHTETSGINEIPFYLLETEFLPVMKRPQNYLAQLTWFGDGCSFSSSKYLVKGEHAAMIAGSQVCIVNESPPEGGGCGQISPLIASALQISTPSCESVIKHLMHIVNVYNGEEDRDSLKPRIEAACDKIYRHFELLLSEGKIFSSDLEDLRQSKCVWTGLTFISPLSVARQWQRNGPCLYSVPHLLVPKENLLGALGVNNEFTIDHYTAALEEIYSQRSILNDREISTISEIADKIAKEIKDDDESTGIYYLPDTERVMRHTNDLAYNDAPWCAIDDDCHFIHHQISRPTALKLGVVAVRSKALQTYESSLQEWDGVPFGQHEELTQRIKNILDEYPLDITVLKELLQNADDAGASKLYVILDKRTHGHYRIPSSDWKDLQGPALLVWNDRGFSAKDLRGIQKLGLGSKRSNTEMIGQYGIGFNVVYHLTDCPSFFTNGDTLCVLDPHCSYVPGATSLKPGRMYDRVGDRFWKNWSDMKSCYLHDCDPNMKCPPELQESEGTLFRLPLRHTSDLVKKSKLLDHENHSFNTPLGSWKMEEYLSEWAPRMKEALLFLKNVRELKFYVISDCPKPSFLATHHFKAHLEQDAAVKCGTFFKQVHQFTSNLQPFVTLYPLNLLEMEPKKSEEKWLIQQGVGDIQNDQQHWEYLTQMKPQHGIAASTSRERLRVPSVDVHRVFCFLPLPLESRLPVHVNGKFVLDAARSGLWQSRDPTRPDDKQIWNKRLVEAAASSYVEFLVSCRERYISPEQYSSPEELKADITRYYNLFPRWDGKIKPEAEMNELSQSVYRGLLQRNPSVLAVIRRCTTQLNNKKGNSFSVEWLPLKNDKDGSKQAYFLEDKEETKAIAGILKKIGIQLTVAPIYIQWHLSESDSSESKLPLATPKQVFQYYCRYCMIMGNTFPCPVTDSVFGSVDRFMTFVKYIIQEEHLENGTFFKFPESPNDIPLLLTASSMLCKFSDSDKVISSEFANIFSTCGERFIHPDMFKLKLIPSYFLEPSESNWNFIRGILRRVLPTSLTVERVRHASDHINVKDRLKPLWKCITRDEVFKVHIRDILDEWALMLSKQNELFSLRSCDKVAPIVPPSKSTSAIGNSTESAMSQSDNESDLTEKTFQIMEKCRVPILDMSVVSVRKYCPVMSEPDKVLQTLYYLHKNGELDLLLRDPKLDSKIETLFKYFSGIHFSHEQGKVSLARIKSLPLFKSIDNTYCSLPNESLIWPHCISSSGQDTWLKEISQTKVVFLKQDGLWNKLGSAAVLGIKEISALLLYVRFIFPHFPLLSEHDRLKHLQYIRNNKLFETAYHESEAEFESEKKSESMLFLASLKQLPCLMKAGQLRPICDFCNPNIPILSMFLSGECFPPATMRDEDWLYFLNKIGLRVKATKEEFLTFCRRVSATDCDDVFRNSKALLEYLFAEVMWHAHEHIEFLNDVSEIPFVCAELLKPLAWIAPCADVENVVYQGKKTFKLTSIRAAASYDNRRLLWTTKPIISLPFLSYHKLKLSRQKWEEKKALFYQFLQICVTPPYVEVVQNILNISKSRFSNFKLFDTYSKDCISQQKGKEELLCEVLVDCFTYLQGSGYRQSEMLALKDVPCIPVCSDGSTTNLSKPVLVKPLQAIIYNDSEIAKFVPFLNPLPQCLHFAYHMMLEVIGVNSEVRYDNIRFALDVMRKHVKQPLDINTVEIVKMLIKKLYQCLQNVDSQGPFTTNDVLYLPNRNQQLVESTKLLFNDKDNYRSHQFDLSQVPVSFLSLLVHKFEELGEYRFTSREFYSTLPCSVRPLLLSTQTVERLSSTCIPDKNLTEFAEKIKQALTIPDFAKITTIMIGGHSEKHNDSCQRFSQGVSLLCESVEVLSVPNLTVDIFLKAHQSLTSIGTAKVDYLLETASNSISLYIDSAVHALTFNFFESLTSSIISFAAERSEVNVKCLDQPERAIGSLLKCPTSHQIKEMLHRLGINSANIELSGRINFDVTPKLGETIPEELHHRLHFDILNVFRPQEWVAYEDREDHYIFARIEYCINVTLHKHEGDGELDNSEELSRYSIITSETDEIGIEVSVIDLRKILRMKEVVKDDGSTEVILYSSDSDSVHLWNAVKDDKLKSILKEICQELRRIWNTGDKVLWRKGKKAMYLKWHPDKNNTPFATKAFQFLLRQIERLEQGKPLEDPDDLDTDEVCETSPQQTETYSMWDDLAAREREYWEKERTRGAQQSSFDDNIQVNPDDNAAKAWFEQAKCDLIATQILLRETYHEERVCAHVCFLAHQVVEKALKAGMYKLFGLQSSTHNLCSYACAIERQVPTSGGLQVLARQLEGHYIQARYPDAYYPPSAPSTHYKPDQATTAEHSAKTIVDIIQQIVYPGS